MNKPEIDVDKIRELLEEAKDIKAAGLEHCYQDADETRPCDVVASKDELLNQALSLLPPPCERCVGKKRLGMGN